jgi:diaminopimelate decarboxylase
VDLGGGLGIGYEGQSLLSPAQYAATVLPELRRLGLPVVLEPGRAVVGHAGALIARIVDVKRYPDGRQFAVLDAGMTELMRPALYGSFHRIVPVSPRGGDESLWDLVGPICESSDIFGRERSNYNRRLLAPEVLVDDSRWTVIRRRQTLDDVLALET